jgi:hypothetical protein
MVWCLHSYLVHVLSILLARFRIFTKIRGDNSQLVFMAGVVTPTMKHL